MNAQFLERADHLLPAALEITSRLGVATNPARTVPFDLPRFVAEGCAGPNFAP
jgi:hypothetical protein